MSEESRRKILERRAAFVAAALATVGAASCERNPLVCLSPVPNEDLRDSGATTSPDTAPPEVDARPDVAPMGVPCLSVAMPRDAGVPDTKPPPKPPKPPPPQPCLKMPPPGEDF